MKLLQFSIDIHAPKAKVWAALWDDAAFRVWASIIDEGTCLKGDLIEGHEVQFLNVVNGYGVTSLVQKLVPGEYVLFRHSADTQQGGEELREKEWTGGTESYTLMARGPVTTLTVQSEIPEGMEDIFQDRLPRALACIKGLAENQ